MKITLRILNLTTFNHLCFIHSNYIVFSYILIILNIFYPKPNIDEFSQDCYEGIEEHQAYLLGPLS